MKKLLGLGTVLLAAATLSACSTPISCSEDLDNCNRGGPYTEERTATAPEKVMVEPAPAPAPAPAAQPVPQPAPAPVVVKEPAPAPAPAPEPVIDDSAMMTSAEEQFSTISK